MKRIKKFINLFLALLLMLDNAIIVVPTMASSVGPTVVQANTSCQDQGYDFGLKIDELGDNDGFDGTYQLKDSGGSPPTELTGGAPEDLTNSITISNSDGTYFDWSATLGIDAVIVKGGPNSNVYKYDPPAESMGDTGLHAPINSNNNKPFGLSHVEFCYDYEYSLDVSKTAETSFTRTYTWDIDKSVEPETLDMFKGDTSTVDYRVDVTRNQVDSDWKVEGKITVENNTPLDATVESIEDNISGGIMGDVDCNVDFDNGYVLGSGETLVCSYEANLPDGSNRTNTATVTTDGNVDGGEATRDVVFTSPTKTVGSEEVTVNDSNNPASSPWTFQDSGSVSYSQTLACNQNEGVHTNTATIEETEQESTASVEVHCHELNVSKTVNTSFSRIHSWTITKSAVPTALTLQAGATGIVNYNVLLGSTSQDRNWGVDGEITVTNPAPINATINDVTDVVSLSVAAQVDCDAQFPYTLEAGQALVCNYETNLPNDDDRINTATAVLQNYDYDAGQDGTLSGETTFDTQENVDFENADVTETDECVEVSDSLQGTLGTVCASDEDKQFDYQVTVGPYSTPGVYTVDNVASFVTSDTETAGEDDEQVTVTVNPKEEILGDTDEKKDDDNKPSGSILGATSDLSGNPNNLSGSGREILGILMTAFAMLSLLTLSYFVLKRSDKKL